MMKRTFILHHKYLFSNIISLVFNTLNINHIHDYALKISDEMHLCQEFTDAASYVKLKTILCNFMLFIFW